MQKTFLGLAAASVLLPLAAYAATPAGQPVAITGASASSILFADDTANKAIDRDTGTIWAPQPTDATPTLILDLSSCTRLSALSVLQGSQATRVDVAIARAGGAWVPVASDLAPVAGQASWLDLPDTDANRVRLTFHGTPAAQLRVYEVQALGWACGTTSQAPTIRLTPLSTASHTPAPQSAGCTRVAGGGWIWLAGQGSEHGKGLGKGHGKGKGQGQAHGKGKGLAKGDGHKLNFSFAAGQYTGRAWSGHVRIMDPVTGQTWPGRVKTLSRNGDLVTLTGELKGSGTFTIQATDGGTGYSHDRFAFSTSTGYSAAGPLGGGQITVTGVGCQ